ncbi:MAG: hypothetical protein HY820_16625 [Acidobacteria bacterium]|nr:hypothetical protein [Acidobacteriota bacterium]
MSTNWEPDLQGYALGELSEVERGKVEQYLAANPAAALEVERLGLVTAALRRMPEEEPPRRIAFVSDKVFLPKWYERIWNSGAKLGFASAALLAMAIVAHGVIARPAPVVSAAVSQVELQKLVDAEVTKRVDAVVAQVKAEADAKSQGLVNAALDQAEKKFAIERQQDRMAVEASFTLLRQQMTRALYVASNERPQRRGDQ